MKNDETEDDQLAEDGEALKAEAAIDEVEKIEASIELVDGDCPSNPTDCPNMKKIKDPTGWDNEECSVCGRSQRRG